MPKGQAATQGSSTNELSQHTNKQRIGGRVADIFGKVKAIPDLIAPPYSYYNSNGVEIEECLMCLGRGHYQISDVQDGDTAIEGITGAAASFYDLGTSIIRTPEYQAGTTFTELPRIIKKSPSINGQSLTSPNQVVVDSDETGGYFTTGGVIHRTNSDINFTTISKLGVELRLRGLNMDKKMFHFQVQQSLTL